MRGMGFWPVLAVMGVVAACGQPGDKQSPAGGQAGAAEPSVSGGGADPDALAREAVAAQRVPDPDGRVALALAEAVRALPAWAPFYPGARLSLDSGAESSNSVQVGFVTADSDDKVAGFYLKTMRAIGVPTDLPEDGIRSIEVANADQTEITSVILSPDDGGGVSGIISYNRAP